MNRTALTLTCPHCFQKLELPDRSFVGKRSGCPQCEGVIYLAADSARGVVGLLPGKHSASALLVHGILNPLRSTSARPSAAPTPAETVPTSKVQVPSPASSIPPAPPAPVPARAPVPPPPNPPLPAPPPPTRIPASRHTAPVSTPKPFTPPASPTRSRGILAIIGSSVAAVLALFLLVRFWPTAESPDGPQEVASPIQPASDGGQVTEGSAKSAESPDPIPPDHLPEVARQVSEEPADPSSKATTIVATAEIPSLENDLPEFRGDPGAVTDPADDLEAALAEIPDESPAAKPIDVAQRLEQPIKKFEQVQGVPAVQILNLLEEMLGVPVMIDREELGPAGDGLDRSISLRLHSTTVGGILEATLEKAGLGWTIEGESIRIRRRDAMTSAGERGPSVP